ncbi:MFS transporter [uncultured Georgenia sp.]|uniref:MFS transporter n=1 Tax=uncultured Georgenia sp. TaxID=378209 RepID=UPI00260CCFCE|nr:MFS transporter [uncultured Georgenia sp.]
MTHFPSPARRVLPWTMVLGVVIVAVNLRGPIVAPAPVLGPIREDLGLSSTVAGLLTSLPVLCFALAGPVASWVIRRVGPDSAVVLTLLGVLLGTVVRSAGPAPTVLIGTAIIGAAIMVGNIVVPVLIRRDVPWQRAGMVTGLYTAAMNVGSMLTSLGTAPLASVVGWRWALAVWGLLAAAGVVYWRPLARRARAAAADAAPPTRGTVRLTPSVSRISWLLLVAFGGQSFAYYAVSAWLPTLLSDTRGLDAAASGVTASLFQIFAVVGAFGVPALAARAPGWVPVATVAAGWVTMPIGLLLAPEAYLLWSVLGGIGQGGGFTAILSIIARVTGSDAEAATVSARVQTGGYVISATGAPLVGAVYAATGGWSAPLLVVLTAALSFAVTGVVAALLARRHQPH